MEQSKQHNGLFNAVVALYVIAPLPLGSNRLWAWLALAGCGFGLLAAWVFAWARGQIPVSPALQGRPGRVAVVLLMVVAAWMFMQTLPLPASWMAVLSPMALRIYQDARAVVPVEQLTMPLSLDSSATLVTGLRSVFFVGLFVLLLQCLDSRRRLKLFCLAIVCSGFFQAVYGGFKGLSGDTVATGSFVNQNHLAGYLEMTVALGTGLLLMAGRQRSEKHRLRGALKLVLSEKALVRLVLILMVSGLILTRSRMGNTAFFSSLLLTGLLAVLVSRQFRKPRVYLLLFSIIMVDILLLGQWFGLEKVAQRLEQTTLAAEQRVEVDSYAVPMVKDFWLTGAGGGSFIHVFPAYAGENLDAVYDHAHNDYLELLGELGIIGFAPLAVFVGLGFCQAWRALSSERNDCARAMGFAGCMGIMSLAFHSSVDFNLQIPANAMLFVAVIAITHSATRYGKVSPNNEF